MLREKVFVFLAAIDSHLCGSLYVPLTQLTFYFQSLGNPGSDLYLLRKHFTSPPLSMNLTTLKMCSDDQFHTHLP